MNIDGTALHGTYARLKLTVATWELEGLSWACKAGKSDARGADNQPVPTPIFSVHQSHTLGDTNFVKMKIERSVADPLSCWSGWAIWRLTHLRVVKTGQIGRFRPLLGLVRATQPQHKQISHPGQRYCHHIIRSYDWLVCTPDWLMANTNAAMWSALILQGSTGAGCRSNAHEVSMQAVLIKYWISAVHGTAPKEMVGLHRGCQKASYGCLNTPLCGYVSHTPTTHDV